jgi:hypothetical protein
MGFYISLVLPPALLAAASALYLHHYHDQQAASVHNSLKRLAVDADDSPGSGHHHDQQAASALPLKQLADDAGDILCSDDSDSESDSMPIPESLLNDAEWLREQLLTCRSRLRRSQQDLKERVGILAKKQAQLQEAETKLRNVDKTNVKLVARIRQLNAGHHEPPFTNETLMQYIRSKVTSVLMRAREAKDLEPMLSKIEALLQELSMPSRRTRAAWREMHTQAMRAEENKRLRILLASLHKKP